MKNKLQPRSRIILQDKCVDVPDSTPVKVFLFESEHGSYVSGTGKLRHIIVATVGYVNDWRAFEAYAQRDAEDEMAYGMIASWGDSILYERAVALAKTVAPDLLDLNYRQ